MALSIDEADIGPLSVEGGALSIDEGYPPAVCNIYLLGTQPKRCFYFVFQRVREPWTQYNRPRYTQEDAEKMAADVADMPGSETMVFGELWRKRWRGAVVDIEEGVLNRWFYGRTVLVGDTAHKVSSATIEYLWTRQVTQAFSQITPNMALGGNSGMESVVVLTNLLHRTLASDSPSKPSQDALTQAFQAYQDQRLPRMRHVMEFSRLITRTQAWDKWFLKMMSIWVLPYLPQRKLANDLGEIIRKAPMLDFVPLGDWDEGLMEWEDMKQEKDPKKDGLAKELFRAPPASVLWVALLVGLLFWGLSKSASMKLLAV
ncbi:MAG: hypothetical protein Q9173_006265 [Seirophora scorigena]